MNMGGRAQFSPRIQELNTHVFNLQEKEKKYSNNQITLDLGMPDKIQDAQLIHKFQINDG